MPPANDAARGAFAAHKRRSRHVHPGLMLGKTEMSDAPNLES